MILNNRKITPYFKKKKWLYTLNQGNSQGSVKGMELSTRVIQDKPVKRFQRQSWGVRFFFSRVSHRRLLGNNAQHKMSLAIVNSDEDRDPPPKLFTPPLLIHLFSTSPMTSHQMDQLLGSVIEMWVDRMDNITQPERRKLSALALLSLLPSDSRWDHFHYWSFVQMGQVYKFRFCFIQAFWSRSDDVPS